MARTRKSIIFIFSVLIYGDILYDFYFLLDRTLQYTYFIYSRISILPWLIRCWPRKCYVHDIGIIILT